VIVAALVAGATVGGWLGRDALAEAWDWVRGDGIDTVEP
jgi:hypothetical protein